MDYFEVDYGTTALGRPFFFSVLNGWIVGNTFLLVVVIAIFSFFLLSSQFTQIRDTITGIIIQNDTNTIMFIQVCLGFNLPDNSKKKMEEGQEYVCVCLFISIPTTGNVIFLFRIDTGFKGTSRAAEINVVLLISP